MVDPIAPAKGQQAGDLRYYVRRPVVRGTQGIVCAGHYLTTMSAVRMLLSGGNAFDAAAAATLAAAVVEPTMGYSLAAEVSLLMYHSSSGQTRVLCGQGGAPGGATLELFKSRGLDKIVSGPGLNSELAFTVPGVLGAVVLMLQTYGTKTLDEVMAPAVEYARRGFPVYRFMARRLSSSDIREQFGYYPPGGTEVFYPGGHPPEVGQVLVQKELAATLGKLAWAEARAGGSRTAGLEAARDAFYTGEIARTIVQYSHRVGGVLSLEDLASYRARFEEPIVTTFMGCEVNTQTTWTQGAVLLQTLNVLEHFDLRTMGHNSPQYIHTITEALKLAFADREALYGDPDYSRVPVAGLLSKEYAAERAGLIRADSAAPELPEAGDPWRYCGVTKATERGAMVLPAPASPGAADPPQDGTTYFSVIDLEGNMVCATPSGGFLFRSVFFPELGFALSTRSETFFLEPGHPNVLQPGKRPRNTLVNYILSKNGRPFLTVGCPGRDNQAQADLQVILNVLLFGMDPQQAVAAPRFATQTLINSHYPRNYLPGQLDVEAGIPGEVRSSLAALGHKIVEADACGDGAIVTQRDPETGVMAAGADPHRTTYAVGW